jgi:hypothetical protein
MPDHGRNLAAGRIVVGAASWAAPDLAAKLIGLKPEPQGAYAWRLFGIRDLTIGLAQIAGAPEHRKRAFQMGILCDLGDTLAALQGKREGTLPTVTAAVGGAVAAGAVGAGFLAIQGLKVAAKAAAEQAAGEAAAVAGGDDSVSKFYAASKALKRPARSASRSSSKPPKD